MTDSVTYELPDEGAVKKALEGQYETARELLEDDDKMERALQRLEKKLASIGPSPKIGELLASAPVLISLVRSYMKKEYRDVPLASMIAIVAALAYFLAHMDIIPDSIPVAGYLDDAAVLYFALNLVATDVEEYKAWREATGRVIDLTPKAD